VTATERIGSGTRLAERYTVLRRLGSGGMATVFLAEDSRLGRDVAIKRLHTDAPGASLKRFRREARLGAALNHPNVVAVHDTIATEDGALIVMEYVDGPSLAELAAAGPMRPERALPILRSVAEALDHAHAEGVVHRDVKPANVLVRDDGVVKLADLGIAKAVGATQITSEGSVIGTLPYMAPERLRGPGAGGPESDVYALAAVAYELLSGRPPREARSEETVDRVPDLRAGWPDGPGRAIAVLERGLDPDPARRQPSAGRLVEELETVLSALTDEDTAPVTAATVEAPVAAPRAQRPFEPPPAAERRTRLRTRPTRAPESRRPSRGLALALLALALLAIAGIGLASGGAGGGNVDAVTQDAGDAGAAEAKPEKEPKPESEPAAESTPAEPVAESSGGSLDGAALNDLGFSLIRQGRYDEAIPVLERAVAALEGSGGVTYAYALFNLGNALRLAGRPEEAIPILEQRLEFPNQRGTVKRELEAARAAAGGGGGGDDGGPPHGKAVGHDKGE
jgi:tetratricopeptide (TPR) repeat protein